MDACPCISGLSHGDVLELLRSLPGDRLNLVQGWHSGSTPLEAKDLENLPPVLIVNLSLHGYVMTPAALSFMRHRNPAMVDFSHDQAWMDAHMAEMTETFAAIAGLDDAKLARFLDRMEGMGLCALDDMLVSSREALAVIRRSRVGDRAACWMRPSLFRTLSGSMDADLRETVTGLKLFIDGAVGTHSAALSASYLDGRRSLPLCGDAALMEMLRDCAGLHKPLSIHAIGDVAIEQVLQCLDILELEDIVFPGVRLEHVQFISKVQAQRAKGKGIVLSMQPNFSSDSRDYEDRLGVEWLERNNPFRMLIDEVGFRPGVDLIFGSDGMPHGIQYAMQYSLFPVFPGQRLTLEELLDGYGAGSLEKAGMVVYIDYERGVVSLP